MFALVADGRSDFQKTLARIFTKQGIDSHWCNTGAELQEAMKVRLVDLVVLGLDVPDIDCVALCRHVRQTIKNPWLPIIILSDGESQGRAAEILREGATDIFRRDRIQCFSYYLMRLIDIARPLDGRVMVVEDTPSRDRMLQDSLTGWGLQVDTLSSLQVVDAYLKEPCDVVLADINPNSLDNGLDFVHDIRRQPHGLGEVPIIALTEQLADATRVNFLARGIDRCLAKPIVMPELKLEIKRQLDARRAKSVLECEKKLESRKSKAKTDFIARMSHELRTSLNAIIGFSNLLIMGDDKDPETREYAGKINSAGKLLLELINEVLDLSHIESGNIRMNLESVGLDAILEKCEQVMQSFAKEHQINLDFDNPLRDVYIRCDITRLTEVILNLISNAIKYNRPGGNIRVTAALTETGFVRIDVTDDGIGISPEYAREIFEPFARAHADTHSVQGTGIGLTIALQLMELMGGKLDFSSRVGRGSTFWVDIPQSVIAAEDRSSDSPARQSALMPCKVMYVDDNPVNCLLIEKWFSKQARAEVCIAGSARDCLAMIDGEKPDVVITDIQMPGESGYWLLQKIRESEATRQLPVVALSAMAMENEVERGKLSGFSAYLTKPFDFQVLIRTVNQLLDFNAAPRANAVDSSPING